MNIRPDSEYQDSPPTPDMLPNPMAEAAMMEHTLTDSQGAFVPDWYKRYDELESYAPTLSKFRRPEALAKSYALLERMKGYPGVEDSSRMAAFRRSVGLPESADEFALTRPENAPDEAWNEALANKLGAVAYEYGVPATAMNALVEHYSDESRRMLETYSQEQQKLVAEADASLQMEWGADYEDNMQSVASFLQRTAQRAGVDVERLIEEPALRSNTDFVKFMLEASRQNDEAPLRQGGPVAAGGASEARRMVHDPSHPLHEAYMKTNHPQHQFANEEYDRLAFGR